ncbi:ATP-grasp domain-containing protein, partial [Chamaesiphon polymorphus]
SIADPVLYLEGLFGQTLAAQFGLRLLEPPLDWLPNLPAEFRKRRVSLSTLGACRGMVEPAFIKPPNDKSFPARVYTGAQLPIEYDRDTPVLVAEVVAWEQEFRCFILDRQIRTISIYLRNGELQRQRDFAASDAELAEVKSFVDLLLADRRIDLPRTAVLDVGVIHDRGWAVVEQNDAWGSGIYGCDPVRVLEVLRSAAIPV